MTQDSSCTRDKRESSLWVTHSDVLTSQPLIKVYSLSVLVRALRPGYYQGCQLFRAFQIREIDVREFIAYHKCE